MSDGPLICQRCQCKTSCLAHVWRRESGRVEKELVCLACRRLCSDADIKEPEYT